MSALAADSQACVWRLDLPGRSVRLVEGEITLGRSRGCGIVLADPCISRVHAVLAVRAGRVYLQDLRSSNGTIVDGEKITGEKELREGDRIAIGNYDLVLHLGPTGEPPPADPDAADADGAENGATREMDPAPSLWQRFAGRLRGD